MNQVENVRKFLWDDAKKLYVHAYDETRKMQWADKTTGHSPNVWSRSVGWWAMALADLAELAEQTDEKAKHRLGQLLEETIKGMLPFRDAQYHMWFQLVEKPDITGNYLETSGSSMMVYAMIKGIRLGLLDSSYLAKALETLQGIEKRYLSEKDGKFYLGGTCSVAGLDNERRNGSVEYYLSEKIAVNEIKGIAPYLFCYAEWMLLKKQKTTN
jgi:unsaturated rhamnogalacturonyl hydrolase